MLFTLAPFTERRNFATWLNEQGLTNNAVEVGTHRGDFANVFLRTWAGQRLFCVDHWQAGYDHTDPASEGDRTDDMRRATQVLRKYGDRARLVRQTSAQASIGHAQGSLDFVYVDACHQYDAVVTDLLLWWPKIKQGGVLAGHDILNDDWNDQVQPAVFHFAKLVGRVVCLVPDAGTDPWSFYMVK